MTANRPLRDRRLPRLSDATLAMFSFARKPGERKSLPSAYLLLFLLGGVGAHRFYVGKKASALAMMAISFGAFVTFLSGIGVLALGAITTWICVDAFLIPGWIRRANDPLGSHLG